MTSRHAGDHGSVSAFVVCLTTVFVSCAGLAVDSGRVVGTHVRVADLAENAARLAAQEITGIRAGDWRIDAGRARAAALSFLASRGVDGSVTVARRRVTVTASTSVRPTLLRMFGVSSSTVRASRSAEPSSP